MGNLLYKMIFIFLLLYACNAGNIATAQLMGDIAVQRQRHREERLRQAFASLSHVQNPCVAQLGRNGDGRYPRLIAREFMTNMVMAGDPKRNLVCSCQTESYMVCNIYVAPGSLEESAVMMRLDRSQTADQLLPFFILEIISNPEDVIPDPIMFNDGSCESPVLCVINVIHNTLPQQSAEAIRALWRPIKRSQSDSKLIQYDRKTLARSESSPTRFHYPTRPLPLRQCIPDACPITQNPFRVNDIVYILRSDAENINQQKAVPCISALAMKQLAAEDSDGEFHDPLRRENGEYLTLSSNYISYVLVGSCGGSSSGDPGPSGVHAEDPGPSQLHETHSYSDSLAASSTSSNAELSGVHVDNSGTTVLHEMDSYLSSQAASSTSSDNSDPAANSSPRSSVRDLISHFEKLSSDDKEKRLATSMVHFDSVVSKIVVLLFTFLLLHFLCLPCSKPTSFSTNHDMYEAIT